MNTAARVNDALRSGPLANRGFRLLGAGQFTSTIGDYCYAVALPWLVLSAHGGAVLLGTVLACYGVPRTVLIPVGGWLADKIGARTTMLTADTLRCGLVAVLVVLAAGHAASLALLGPVAALLGGGEGLFIPASFSIMPSLLEPEHLTAGNAINSAAVQAGSVAGPALGGLLVASGGPAPAFAVDAASFAVSALSLALIRRRPAAQEPAPPGAEAARPGGTPEPGSAGEPGTAGEPGSTGEAESAGESVWSLLRRARILQIIVVVLIAANLASGGTFDVALPALAHARFGAGGYGALMACLGAGAVIGTLTAARGGKAARPALVAGGSVLITGVSMMLIPFLGGLPGAAAATFVLGATNGFGNVIFLTLLQRWAPARMLGRVMSVLMLAGLGTFPVSAAVAGLLVRQLGPSVFFPVAGALIAVAIAGALTQREFRDFGRARPAAARLSAEAA
jgi:predicted MFS family arabinose efflux permease